LYLVLERRLRAGIEDYLRQRYAVQTKTLPLEQPPRADLGDFALPCFMLARELRRAPRQIASELVTEMPLPEGFSRAEVAGGGYVNFFADRGAILAALGTPGFRELRPEYDGKVVVEHTNINPNKAAHVGHLRNAVLGDTLVRLLRARGERVEVQNYIDNTGVQVADVAVAFEHLKPKTPAELRAEIEALNRRRHEMRLAGAVSGEPHYFPLVENAEERGISGGGPSDGAAAESPAAGTAAKTPGAERSARRASFSFDYACWDLYAEISRYYEQRPEAAEWRRQTLQAIEEGRDPAAALGSEVAEAIVEAHLRTMERLNVQYDVLPRESEILHLHFWRKAFELLREKAAIRLETEGKNAGCWVMDRPVAGAGETGAVDKAAANADGGADASAAEETKVIVRSNGTVTYVGKDIAYQLWKFGLLGLDFGYRVFRQYPDGSRVWVSSVEGEADAPPFGRAVVVFNVIDVRQSYLQDIVAAGLRALGFHGQAERSVHFDYEMVSLTRRCADELGFELSDEERTHATVEVSGRRGLGVKADDLLDRLIEGALAEVSKRHPQRTKSEQLRLAIPIAIGAVRYFLLKFTRTTLIAFDLQDALSFEGETGPYVQYAAVRAANILRKSRRQTTESEEAAIADEGIGTELPLYEFVAEDVRYLDDANLWHLVQFAARLEHVAEGAIAAGEPAYIAHYAFQLAQAFNNFYHRTPVLAEADSSRRRFLLALVYAVRLQLAQALGLMGIEVPEAM
jgi:arginyl-tRNA synthetase